MDPLVFVLVAGAAVLHVTWNVLLKTAGDPLRAAAVGMTAAALAHRPGSLLALVARWRRRADPAGGRRPGRVSGIFEAAYFVFLAAAYRRGDLSVVYPIARGTAPLLAVFVGVVILGERLGPEGFLGVALLLVGLLMLQRPWRYFRRSADGGGWDPAVGFALLTGVMIASYSAVDKVGRRVVEPWLYAGLIWVVHGVPASGSTSSSPGQVAAVAAGSRRGAVRRAAGRDRRPDHARRVSADPRRVQRRPADRRRAAARVGDRARVRRGGRCGWARPRRPGRGRAADRRVGARRGSARSCWRSTASATAAHRIF